MQQPTLHNSCPGWRGRYVGGESSKVSGKRDLPSVNSFHFCPGINNFFTFMSGFAGIRHMGQDLQDLVVMAKLFFQSPSPAAV